MKIYGKCQNCKNEVSTSTYMNTRIELKMQIGETKVIKCKACDSETKFYINKLYAKESKLAQFLAGFIFLIGTPLVFFMVGSTLAESRGHYIWLVVGGFLIVPVTVYSIIKKQDQLRVNSFNS
ncbi:MAG: hypothetical protein ACJA2M_002774 [Polaribacter sp.]|jgi:hypothetical protein